MAPHNEEDDPAVYRAGTYKKSAVLLLDANGNSVPVQDASSDDHPASTNGHSESTDRRSSPTNGTDAEEEDVHSEPASDEDEEDSTLLTVQPGFNRLLLVLRDERVMRFVKYVSAAADGSRWDVCAEYEVGVIQEEAMDED